MKKGLTGDGKFDNWVREAVRDILPLETLEIPPQNI
jgi:hypothetical protein